MNSFQVFHISLIIYFFFLIQGNRICDSSLSSVTDQDPVIDDLSHQDLTSPGPSSNGSVLLLPISSSTRSKKKQPITSSSGVVSADSRKVSDLPEKESSAVTSTIQQEQSDPIAKEVFERPLTRARKRHIMARVYDAQASMPKQRKNV